MIPVSPVFPKEPWLKECVFAKDQPQYLPLPAYTSVLGCVVTRWRLSFRERLQVLLFGHVWLSVSTFNQPLQPVRLAAEAPDLSLPW